MRNRGELSGINILINAEVTPRIGHAGAQRHGARGELTENTAIFRVRVDSIKLIYLRGAVTLGELGLEVGTHTLGAIELGAVTLSTVTLKPRHILLKEGSAFTLSELGLEVGTHTLGAIELGAIEVTLSEPGITLDELGAIAI